MKQITTDKHLENLQAMGLLTSGIAHDFNNILAIIEGYAHILDHHSGSDPFIHDKIAAILSATQRGTELTRGLLNFGYPQTKTPLSECDLVMVINENKPLLRSLLSSRIQIVLQLPPSPLLLSCPADIALQSIIRQCHEMRQSITGTGRVLFHVTSSADTATLVLTNKANGMEISHEFPRLIDGSSLQDKTVLIVDDEESLLPILEHQLKNMGLKVLKAANADSALLLQKDYPDVIDFLLTDIVMPDVDGVQLAEMMTDNRPRMGVVYMTGHASQKAGIDIPAASLIVPKPLRPDTLSQALQKALEHVQEAID